MLGAFGPPSNAVDPGAVQQALGHNPQEEEQEQERCNALTQALIDHYQGIRLRSREQQGKVAAQNRKNMQFANL